MDGGVQEELSMTKKKLLKALNRLNDECEMLVAILREKDAQINQQLNHIGVLQDLLLKEWREQDGRS